MYSYHYSLFSEIDRYHFEKYYNLDLKVASKMIVDAIEADAKLGRLDKPVYNEFHYIAYINYVPINELRAIVFDLFKEYSKVFPFNDLGKFISEYFGMMIFECKQISKVLSNGKINWWESEKEFDYYTYFESPNSYNMICWTSKTDNDVHFYAGYFDAVVKLLEHEIFETSTEVTNTQTVRDQIKFYGTQTEFIELVKALIENGNLKGKQKDIISEMARLFDVEINNPDKLISDINKRNIGSETLFLDRLKSSLFNYIQSRSK